MRLDHLLPRARKRPLRLLADALRQRAAGVLSRSARRRLLRLLHQRSRARADVAER